MSLSDEEIAFARDLFSGLGPVTTRKMFGGIGIYYAGAIFAVMRSDGEILLKGANGFGETLAAAGGEPWLHERGSMPYWTLPPEAMDDPDAACDWARRAIDHL